MVTLPYVAPTFEYNHKRRTTNEKLTRIRMPATVKKILGRWDTTTDTSCTNGYHITEPHYFVQFAELPEGECRWTPESAILRAKGEYMLRGFNMQHPESTCGKLFVVPPAFPNLVERFDNGRHEIVRRR